MILNQKIDIYDGNEFDVDGLHCLEEESPYKVPFRWSEGKFSITPKVEVSNILINFLCLNEDKKIVLFLESDSKNIKYEQNLKCGVEYVLALNFENYKSLSIYVTPNVKLTNEDIRTLGLFIKKIYTIDKDVQNIELKEKTEDDFQTYFDEKTYQDQFKLEETSIFKQKQNVDVLSFNYNSKNFIFNSALFEFNNKQYIAVRHSSFVTKKITDNTIKIYEYPSLKPIELFINDEQPFEQYEDPRVFVHDNKMYVSCANYTHDKFHLVHQKILIFDHNFKHIGNIHPKYGFNGKSIIENTGKEKNWTFFVKDNRLFCVYSIDPHVVVEFDWNGNVIAESITYFNTKKLWKYGVCRGGTNPVLKDNKMHCFFHSSIPWGKGKRRYLMAHYAFNPEPPFNIIELDSEPILWGNEVDDRIFKDINPIVVFPCGSILENDKFVVSFGFNDEKTGIIKI